MRYALIAGAALALCTSAARAQGVRDVAPDMALVFSNFSESYAFAGERDLLVVAGRSGFHRTDNAGARWRRAMAGFVDSNGTEPFAFGFCQAPSQRSTVYSGTGAGLGARP